MSNYTKSTNFATKDNLTPGDPLKIVRGTEIDTEYNNIATAIATKTDNASAAITGGSITGITDLAVADGGTGASTAAGGLNNLLPSQTGNANKYLQTDGTNATWDAVTLSTADITGTLPVANGGTGVTSSTGTGSVVLSNSPTLVTPALGTPASGTATNLTGLPISTGVSGLGTGVATFLGTPSSANLASAVTDETGSGALVFANSPTLVTPALGTPSALVGTNITGTASGLTAGNVTTNANLTGAVTSVGNATSLGSFSSANLLGALTDETGTGSAVFANTPTLVTPILGTPTSATLTNATGLPIATGVSGLGTGVATALAVNVGSSGAPLVNGGVLGTPSSGTATNLTGLPLTTGVTGTLPTANGGTNLTSFTSGGVVYASSSSALATGSALTFDGSNLSTTGQVLLENNKYIGFKNTSGTYAASIFNDTSNFLNLYNSGNTGTIFYVNAAEQMRLTSTGLGIGTSSPAARLSVIAASANSTAATIGGIEYGGSKRGLTIKTFQSNGGDDCGVEFNAANGLAGYGGFKFVANTTTLANLDYSSNLSIAGNFDGGYGKNISLNADDSGQTTRLQWKYSGTAQAWVERVNANGAMAFGTQSAERMRITGDGNVGIGTSSPISTQSGLDISSGGLSLIIGADNGSSTRTNAGNKSGRFAMAHYTNAEEPFAIALCDVTSTTNELSLGGGSGACNTATVVKFFTAANNTTVSGTERARFTSDGYFKASNNGDYVGITSTYHELYQNSSSSIAYFASGNASPNGVVVSYRTADPNGTGNHFIYCEASAGTQRMSVRSNGGIANYSANDVNLSDRREKTNFAPATSYLDKICAIPVQTFNYIDQNLEEDGGLTLGVVAQDVQAVAPELVMESNWANKDAEPKMRLSIYQTDLQYALMKCIQEQQAIIESLKARLDAANL